jgi:hypothetical protein
MRTLRRITHWYSKLLVADLIDLEVRKLNRFQRKMMTSDD